MKRPRFIRPSTVFGKTALTITVAFVVIALFTVAAFSYYALVPVAQRSAEDLAALMVLSAQTWVELPPGTRHDFQYELHQNHGLTLTTTDTPLENLKYHPPYLSLLEAALAQRTGQSIPVRRYIAKARWFWVDIPIAGRNIRIGFPRDRIEPRPPVFLLLILLSSGLLVQLTAMILARRITQPLSLLSRATERIGKGQLPEPLPETGAEELANLTRQFNQMARQVRDLLANRTTLLAGISHDLRTPIARMRLALEMLPQEGDPHLVEGLKRDLEEMNDLIGQFMELSRELEAGHREPTDLASMLEQLVGDVRRSNARVEWFPCPSCVQDVNATALRRVVGNLVENALRYGAGAPVTLILNCNAAQTRIRVLDRGPGIPADQRDAVFRPFYRLEQSRSSDTGGSGLGLAIARQLADANGWTIRLLDRRGGGTEVQLILPAPQTNQSAA